jgi:hypothetical protein
MRVSEGMARIYGGGLENRDRPSSLSRQIPLYSVTTAANIVATIIRTARRSEDHPRIGRAPAVST